MAAHWPAMKQRWRYVALMGGLGLAGFTSLFSLGAQHTTAVNLGITQGAIPAFVMLFGLLVFGTPVGKLHFWACCCHSAALWCWLPVITSPCY